MISEPRTQTNGIHGVWIDAAKLFGRLCSTASGRPRHLRRPKVSGAVKPTDTEQRIP